MTMKATTEFRLLDASESSQEICSVVFYEKMFGSVGRGSIASQFGILQIAAQEAVESCHDPVVTRNVLQLQGFLDAHLSLPMYSI